jgi:hypothetical protein
VQDQGGMLAGYSAALLHGADCAPVAAPAEVLVPGTFRRHPGLVVRYGLASGSDVSEVAGFRVTSPLRTAWDLCRRLKDTEAVVALDALARRGRFAPTDLLARRDEQPGARGCRWLDEIVAAADPREESPQETRLRLDLIRAGLPRPEVQFEIRDEYGFLLRAPTSRTGRRRSRSSTTARSISPASAAKPICSATPRWPVTAG